MTRLGPLVLLLGVLARCGGATQTHQALHITMHRLPRPAYTILLHPGEQRTLTLGAWAPGDRFVCTVGGQRLRIRIPFLNHLGGWSAFEGTETSTPGGSGAEIQASQSSDGAITASCKS